MNTFIVTAAVVGTLALMVFLYISLYRSAVKKGRSGIGWVLLSFIAGGPLFIHLLLASFPKLGNKASGKQLTGRSIYIVVIVLLTLLRFSFEMIQQETITQNALEKHGFESETVYTHDNQMDVNEIVECLVLTEKQTMTAEFAVLVDDIYEFETQEEADAFNAVGSEIQEKGCNDRTYDYEDLDKAMKIMASR